MPGARTFLREPEVLVETCRCRVCGCGTVWGVETGMCGGVGEAVGVDVGGRVTLEAGLGPCPAPCVASCVECIE
jgi:hypothetical protein